MRALVTGGAGFIGSHVVDYLLAHHHQVTVVDNLSSGKRSNLANLPITFHEKDINDPETHALYQNHDWVFHLAGLADVAPSFEKPVDYYHTNVTGTLSVLEACRKAKVQKVVYAASASCYGNPQEIPTSESASIKNLYPYALTKCLGEQLAMHWAEVYQLPVISLRLFNVYGPRSRLTGAYSSVFGVFLKQMVEEKPLTIVGDGEQTRDFVYVLDVAKAFYLAAKSDIKNEIFNVGCSKEHTVNEIADLLRHEKIHIPPRDGEPRRSCANNKKIRQLLNWQPDISLQEGVRLLLEHSAGSAQLACR